MRAGRRPQALLALLLLLPLLVAMVVLLATALSAVQAQGYLVGVRRQAVVVAAVRGA
jgi:hypothetical protein